MYLDFIKKKIKLNILNIHIKSSKYLKFIIYCLKNAYTTYIQNGYNNIIFITIINEIIKCIIIVKT